jgi:uncharacterized protein (DUF952 family)
VTEPLKKLYRIMTPAQYKEVRTSGFFMPAELEREGHVYACYLYQAEFVAGLLYHGEFGLTLLEIDPVKLDCEVEDKNLKGGTELFPHIKGPIPASACVSEYPLPVEGDGSFELPIQLQEEYQYQLRKYGIGRA